MPAVASLALTSAVGPRRAAAPLRPLPMRLVTRHVGRCGVVAWLLATGVCLAAGQTSPPMAAGHRVIILTAESPELSGAALMRQSVVSALRGGGEPVEIYEEAIDTSRFPSSEYDASLAAMYRAKYGPAPSLVITLAKPALDFVLRHQDVLFRDTPILFGFIDERSVRALSLRPNITGVFVDLEARATVEAALALHPGTRRVVVVGGTSPDDRAWTSVVQQDLRPLEPAVSFTYLTDVPFETLLADVAALRDQTLVLFTTMTVDGDGAARLSPDVVAELRRVAEVPIYGMGALLLGRGIVGGVTPDVRRHGADVGRRAQRLLAGEQAADLAPIRTPNLMAFDWRELQRFSIDEARLPAGATVVNRERGLWDVYKRTILLVAAALVGQSC